MPKKNNLDQYVAEAAQKGISYGKLMAAKASEQVHKPEPEKQEPEKPKAIDDPVPIGYRTCEWCGKEFPIYNKRKHIFCSNVCAQKAYQQKYRDRHKPEKEKESMKDMDKPAEPIEAANAGCEQDETVANDQRDTQVKDLMTENGQLQDEVIALRKQCQKLTRERDSEHQKRMDLVDRIMGLVKCMVLDGGEKHND